jgi:acylphosphatase
MDFSDRPIREVMVRKTVGIIYAASTQYGKRSLDSFLRQKTPLDRIIYIDDGIHSEIDREGIEYHKSQKKLGFLHHLYTTVHQLEDEEIVIPVKGGDELAHEKVVENLKAIYEDEEVWATYGGGMRYPDYRKNPMQEISLIELIRKTKMEEEWEEGHMKSFYAGVFKKINITQFLVDGVFVKEKIESLFMIPMLEICEEKGKFLSNIHYLYN